MMRSVSDGESLAQSKSRTRTCGKLVANEIGKRFGGIILSADSMHILAKKATAEELSECPQHLIIENKYY